MDGLDHVARMAVDAERGGHHCGRMAVDVVVEISGMAVGASASSNDGGNFRPIDRVFQGRRCGVAIRASAVVDGSWISRRMTECDAGRIISEDKGGIVIYPIMGRRSPLVLMAIEAVDGAGIVRDDKLDVNAARSLGVDVTSGVMTGATVAEMTGQDIRPVLDRVTI